MSGLRNPQGPRPEPDLAAKASEAFQSLGPLSIQRSRVLNLSETLPSAGDYKSTQED